MIGSGGTRSPLRTTARWPLSELVRDSACSRDFNWRCDLPLELATNDVVEAIKSAGWTLRCRHPALVVARHSRGHEIAWVLRTGRVQLRVATDVERRERPEAAVEMYDFLATVTRASMPREPREAESP